MLIITVSADELYDEVTETFSVVGGTVVKLEHSLISLSKWESKHQKPFLTPGNKTTEEVLDYIKMMICNEDVTLDIVEEMNQENVNEINSYIESKESATTFSDVQKSTGRGEIITAELIYYWMVSFNIPFECQYWHLNRLFALIRICSIKNSKQKKMSRRDVAARNRELNAQRKAQLGTTG